jgi:hypothetical protein
VGWGGTRPSARAGLGRSEARLAGTVWEWRPEDTRHDLAPQVIERFIGAEILRRHMAFRPGSPTFVGLRLLGLSAMAQTLDINGECVPDGLDVCGGFEDLLPDRVARFGPMAEVGQQFGSDGAVGWTGLARGIQ